MKIQERGRKRVSATRRPNVGRALLGLLIAIVSSCADSDSRLEQPSARTSESAIRPPVEDIVVPGSDAVSIEQAIDSLRRLPGLFTEDTLNPAAVEFEGETHLFRALRSKQMSAVEKLIECIARNEEVVATYRSRKVSLGYMCFTALESFVYVEATADSGDSAGAWRGRITPDADRPSLLASQAAWREMAVRGGIVVLPP